ncbi:Anti-sigma regulatory factor (Ser/Thr protein kinase) [Sinosporangium album]|uniref:Anti-sigma regulatory factor (Ser/Thr protein kinase) n=1 Tax=Sinosporangium album TaxID=504805 RepID=A0A1G8KWG8_9ACTN|nr:ATP-binding protein [Sinosporangium album]SDI47732.1 Anti-sigma regulatory factor (Ser/Thr protein kinase) [Sinosporangium album]
MVEEPVAAADCLQVTRRLGFDNLLTAERPDTTTCPLPPQADSVKTARDVTRSTLDQWGLSELGDDAVLVVSELVTNAVRYALYPSVFSNGHRRDDHPITLMLLRYAPHVLLAVSDPSDEAPTPKEPDFISENGRGLYIVETYSQCWGWDHLDRGGKAVWALFRTGS